MNVNFFEKLGYLATCVILRFTLVVFLEIMHANGNVVIF